MQRYALARFQSSLLIERFLQYLHVQALRSSERDAGVPDPGDLTVFISLELECTKVLLALERRLAKISDNEDMCASLRSARDDLEAALNKFVEVSDSASDKVAVWCRDHADEQRRSTTFTLRMARPSVAEASARVYHNWTVIQKQLDQLTSPPAPGALGLLLLAMERRALGMEDILPSVAGEIPDVPGSVVGILNKIATTCVS